MSEPTQNKGRPKGSRNKRTEEFRSLIEAIPNFKHPGVFLVEQYMDTSLDPALRIKCADAVLPYLESKLKQIEVSGIDGAAISNTYTWLTPEPEGTIPMATAGMSMDELDDEEEDPDA